MKRSGALLVLAVFPSLQGCLVLPLPESYDAGSRLRLSAARTHHVTPGRTTREEILSELGEPDLSLKQGALLAYVWSRLKPGVAIAVAAPGGGAEADLRVREARLFLVRFDDRGRVERSELVVVSERFRTTTARGQAAALAESWYSQFVLTK